MLSRRQILHKCGLGFGTLALANLLKEEQGVLAAAGQINSNGPLAPRGGHFSRKVKSVIWIMLNGGPSQMDTWDYKPELQRRAGQKLPGADLDVGFNKTNGRLLASPFHFSQYGESGSWVSNIFPFLAKHVDDMTFVHSCFSDSNNHSPALFQINTGMNRMGFPCVGSWIVYGMGTENANLPGFVVMTDALGRGFPKGRAQNWGAGFLPNVYQGIPLNNTGPPVDNLHPYAGQTATQQRTFLDALGGMNLQHQQRYGMESELAARIESFELAFRMQTTAPGTFDINLESTATRKQYGLDNEKCAHFGRQCLIARRLVEQGVRFIQIYSGGTDNEKSWDGHLNIKKNHTQFAAEVDQPTAALLADLKQRGLLEETLVLCCGEFGRTSDAEATRKGRDHNPHAFTTWFAGGGTKGGLHYGATDEFGYKAIENRVTVHDLHATILYLLGIDHQKLTYRFNGRDFRLTDVYGNVLTDILA